MNQNPEQMIAAFERAYNLQKKAREEADQLLEEKSREIYHKNKSLEAAMAKLQQQQSQLVTQEKLASVGQLGASLAHELNNPNAFVQSNLVMLKGYILQLTSSLEASFELADRLIKSVSDNTLAEQARSAVSELRETSEVEFIREDLPLIMEDSLRGTKRITSIANGLRYFANPDLSTRKALNINECIHHAQALVHTQNQLPEMSYDLAELPILQGLPILFSQAIANIIQNAVEADLDGPKVEIKSYLKAQSVYIEIEDHGAGIAQTALEDIFTPFYSTKSAHNGLGLGIAQHIIDQHDGSISIESTEGEGTRVVISLPVGKDETNQDANI